MPIKLNENTQNKLIEKATDKLLGLISGFSMVCILLGVLLIGLGLSNHLNIPAAYYCGLGLGIIGIIFFIGEEIFKHVKLKYDSNKLKQALCTDCNKGE